MKKYTLLFIILFISASIFYSFKKQEDTLKSDFSNYFLKNTMDLLSSYDSLYLYLKETDKVEISYARTLFANIRYSYKRNELMAEYFAPATAAMLNMALIPDADEYDPNQNTIEPEGLQKIEESLYESDSIINKDFIVQELKRTRGAVLRLQQVAKTLEPMEYQLFESSKQELIRIWTINLTGIDAAYSKNSILESKYAIHVIHDVLLLIEKNNRSRRIKFTVKEINKKIIEAEDYLIRNNNFDEFDRMYFVKKFINEIYSGITILEGQLNYPSNTIPTAIYADAKNVFTIGAWNIGYFKNDKKNTSNSSQVDLGRMLFFDPILSGNNKRACASCHRPEYGFAEPLAKSIMFGEDAELSRNAPSLLNTAFQRAYFLDARTSYLEDQVVEVNQNVNEMHGNFDQLVSKLNGSNEYRLMFKNSFKGTYDTTITKQSIINAIASYERSLISLNSKFDKYMRDENIELSKSEINGFNLFMGKAQCGTCHFAPIFNGTVPPNFDETEWEIIGAAETSKNIKLDSDKGRYNVAKIDIHQYAFKTPTVRNVKYTSPYMHNGAYKNLEEVLDFYNNGGGIGHRYEVPNQTLPSDSLKLNKNEIKDIIAFMNSLSDTVGLTKKPSRLPELKVAGQIISRKIGGEY